MVQVHSHSTGEVEFYDDFDPYEMRSLTNEPAHDSTQAQLEALLVKMENWAGAACQSSRTITVPPALQAQRQTRQRTPEGTISDPFEFRNPPTRVEIASTLCGR